MDCTTSRSDFPKEFTEEERTKGKRQIKRGPARVLVCPETGGSVDLQRNLGAVMGSEEVEHMADRAFRVRGRDLAELLEKAASAMVALDGQPPDSERFIRRAIEVQGSDREALLVNWLNEILYLEQTHHEVYDHFLLSNVTDNHLCAQLYGRQLDRSITSVKAVTFHNLEVSGTSEGFEATVVVDV